MKSDAEGTAAICAPPAVVRVGGMAKAELLDALALLNIRLNPAADSLFKHPRFVPSSTARTIEMTTATVAELGFTKGASYLQLTARAREMGLHQCPLELGPHLRMCFVEQPEAEIVPPIPKGAAPPGALTVASAPLDDSDETPKGFYLRRIDGALWLRGYWSWPGHLWSPGDVFVFSRASG